MNAAQRTTIRTSLLDQGFQRTGYTNDLNGRGDYSETWTHPEGTTITVDWAPKDQQPVTESTGTDAPGMYDEPDHGLSLPLPVSAEEDRIR